MAKACLGRNSGGIDFFFTVLTQFEQQVVAGNFVKMKNHPFTVMFYSSWFCFSNGKQISSTVCRARLILKQAFLKKDFIYLFLERGRKEEKHERVVASCAPSTGDLACTQAHALGWESNW